MHSHHLPYSMKKAGFAFAASVMNAVILTAILSAGNSGMYSSTRMLFDMAQNGSAPKVFCQIGPPRRTNECALCNNCNCCTLLLNHFHW